MRAKEVIDEKEIGNYLNSIKRMLELSNIDRDNVLNFISFVDEDGNFTVKTKFPIPSCRCSQVEIEEHGGEKCLYFYYKIYFKGSFEKEFEKFLIEGKNEDYSFYGPVYDLIIFKEKPNRKEDYFQISFSSVNEFYEKLQIQRFSDLRYRIAWLEANKSKIYSDILKYKEAEEHKRSFISEIKANKSEKTIYYRSIDETLSYAKANSEYKRMIGDIKRMRKDLFYPKFINYNELVLSISQNKIKIVSYRVNNNGEYVFYYYK